MTGNQVYLLVLVMLLDPDPHSQYRPRILESQTNADPDPTLILTNKPHEGKFERGGKA